MRLVKLRNQDFFRTCPECDERIKIRAAMLMWRAEPNEYLHPACYNQRVDQWRTTLTVTTDLHNHDIEWEIATD